MKCSRRNEMKKSSLNKNNYHIELIDKQLAKEIIINNHYSKRWSSCRYALGLFRDDKLVGVAVYGFPVGRQVVKSISPILENRDVLELTRLFVEDSEPKNTETMFLSMTFKYLRQHDVKVIISYSDPMYGHVGTIYQASNFLYQGNNTMLVKGFNYKINNEIYHARSATAKFGSVRDSVLREVDPNYEKIEILKKHRYILILDRKMRKKILDTLKHPILSYPKDNKNSSWT
jgi:hypothetical protein